MHEDEVLDLLTAVQAGSVPPADALRDLMSGPFRRSNLAFAEIDHHRRLRHGLGEVVYGEGKSLEQILAIAEELALQAHPTLFTRLDAQKIQALQANFPAGRANPLGRTFIIHAPAAVPAGPHVAVVAAGTSDLPVAEEACEVCVAMATPYVRIFDVGVTGLHRLLAQTDVLRSATALVVIAGMEGALPSVVAGLLGRPVFAVPTSVGYGASFGGVTALLAMLNSCAPGVTVVNIDNGFSAAFAACQVVRAVRAVQNTP